MNNINELLPYELHDEVFRHLDTKQVQAIARTCALWRFLISLRTDVQADMQNNKWYRQFIGECYEKIVAAHDGKFPKKMQYFALYKKDASNTNLAEAEFLFVTGCLRFPAPTGYCAVMDYYGQGGALKHDRYLFDQSKKIFEMDPKLVKFVAIFEAGFPKLQKIIEDRYAQQKKEHKNHCMII